MPRSLRGSDGCCATCMRSHRRRGSGGWISRRRRVICGSSLSLHSGVDTGLHDRGAAVFASLKSAPARLVPCHNDVHARNLLDDGRRLLLVDWEYGGVGDPMFDLAGVVSHHSLDEHGVGVLLEAYGTRINGACLRDACWAYDYVQWLWYRLAARRPGADGDGSRIAAAGIAARLHGSA